MLFDGVDEKINIGSSLVNSLALSTTGTLSLWVKTNGGSVALSVGNSAANTQIMIQFGVTNTIRALCVNAGVLKWDLKTSSGHNPNSWMNVILTHNSTIPTIYIDRVNVAQTFSNEDDKTFYIDDLTNPNNATLGVNAISPQGGFFTGNIDEVSFWDISLSQDQITEIYNNGKPSNLLNHSAFANMVSWYRMGDKGIFDGSNWTLPDQKVSNDGTSVNMEFIDRTHEKP